MYLSFWMMIQSVAIDVEAIENNLASCQVESALEGMSGWPTGQKNTFSFCDITFKSKILFCNVAEIERNERHRGKNTNERKNKRATIIINERNKQSCSHLVVMPPSSQTRKCSVLSRFGCFKRLEPTDEQKRGQTGLALGLDYSTNNWWFQPMGSFP